MYAELAANHSSGNSGISIGADVALLEQRQQQQRQQQQAARRRPHRIEHAQHIAGACTAAALAAAGVAVTPNPQHLLADLPVLVPRLGAERAGAGRTYAFRTLLQAGVTSAFGSDWPVVGLGPLAGEGARLKWGQGWAAKSRGVQSYARRERGMQQRCSGVVLLRYPPALLPFNCSHLCSSASGAAWQRRQRRQWRQWQRRQRPGLGTRGGPHPGRGSDGTHARGRSGGRTAARAGQRRGGQAGRLCGAVGAAGRDGGGAAHVCRRRVPLGMRMIVGLLFPSMYVLCSVKWRAGAVMQKNYPV